MRKIVICGSRSWTNEEKIYRVLKEIRHPREIVHGGAQGADTLAGRVAMGLGFVVTEMPADWTKWGKAAGFKRNIAMLDLEPELVIAFWDGKSKGTRHTMQEAGLRGIPVCTVVDGI
jgi:hypothetical protein